MAALTRAVLGAVCLLSLVAVVRVHCKPMGGKYNETIYSMNATDNTNVGQGIMGVFWGLRERNTILIILCVFLLCVSV